MSKFPLLVALFAFSEPVFADQMVTSIPEASPLALWALGTLILASTRLGRRRKPAATLRRRAADQKTWATKRRAERVADAGAAKA